MPQKKKGFSFKEEYRQSFNYIRESKNFIYIVSGIFLFFVLLGFFVPTPPYLRQQIFEFIQQLLSDTENLSLFGLMQYIFFNNIQSSFFGMVFGVLLGLYPVITLIVNGYLLGFVALETVMAENIFVLWRLFPHGIFELPAVIISMAFGLKLGTFVFQENRFETLKLYFKESLRAFILVIIPLLFVAAIIEGLLIYLTG